MKRPTTQTLAALASAAIVTAAASVALVAGCKGGGGGSPVDFGAVTNMIGGGGRSGNAGSSGSSGSSGNGAVDSMSGLMPKNTGGYFKAGMMAFSSLTLSPDEEDQIGQSVAVAVTNTYPVSDKQALSDYVSLVGFTIASASPRPDGNFVFGVLESNDVNAFSGPNGYVMITRGAIARMQDESELAGVLAHEIAHVCHDDGLNAVKAAKLTGAGAQALKTAMNANDRNGALNVATDAAFDGIAKTGYDQPQELAADRDAVNYVAAAGYDPSGYQRFVERIAAAQTAGSGGLFSTHPGFNERVKVVSDAVAATGRGGTGAANKDRFQASTPGLHG